MACVKEENEDLKIEDVFRVKQEDLEEERQTEMGFVREESEHTRIEEAFDVKHEEDTDTVTDLMLLKEESQDFNDMEVENQYEKLIDDFIARQKPRTSPTTQNTETRDLESKEVLRLKQSTHVTLIKMACVKEENEDLKIEDVFRVKQEDLEEERRTEMGFVREESEHTRIEEAFAVKHEEDTETVTDLMLLKEESQDFNDMEMENQYEKLIDDFIARQKPRTSPTTQNTETRDLESKVSLPTRPKPYACNLCGKTYYRKESLNDHMRFHSVDGSFDCELCGKSYTSKESLNYHMKVHTGEKPYSCKLCGKSFIRQGNLKCHKATHTGEKPFTCQECGKCYAAKGNLKVHMRQHTGERPFKCPQCDMSFTYSRDLKRHWNIHSKVQ